MNDPISDMLTRIKNAHQRNKAVVRSPVSKIKKQILTILEKEGFIRGHSESTLDGGKIEFNIELKYDRGSPAITEIKRVSKPGRRVYSSVRGLPYFYDGMGISIVSTPQGLMSDSEAREKNVGGEILCKVF
ncbi:MAG: 30S ribosomal protein S8 [Pseudomonadota bacterium]|mgnify:FL=1|jgi:small subunit ribosomal protein S8|nr:30S ribosomal protein S8 [Pseudomonadota bacterium]